MTEGEKIKALLAKTQTVTLPMLTGSMAPMILPGDKITIKPADAEDIFPGDIAVFFSNSKLTAHRILHRSGKSRPTRFYEKGDANSLGGHLSPAKIVGRVITIKQKDTTIQTDSPEYRKMAEKSARNTFIKYIFLHKPKAAFKRIIKKIVKRIIKRCLNIT